MLHPYNRIATKACDGESSRAERVRSEPEMVKAGTPSTSCEWAPEAMCANDTSSSTAGAFPVIERQVLIGNMRT